MLVWTKVLAIVLGILKWAGLFDSFSPGLSMSLAGMIFLGPCRALPAFAALWTVLGQGVPIRRIPALVFAEIASLGLPSMIRLPGSQEFAGLVWFMAMEAVVLAGSLLAFRMIGYRVRWRRRGMATESCEVASEAEGQAE